MKKIMAVIATLLTLAGSESHAALRHSVRNLSSRPIVVRMEFHAPGPGCRGCWLGINPMPPRPQGISMKEWDRTWRNDANAVAWEKEWNNRMRQHARQTLGLSDAQLNRNRSYTGWAECRGPTAGRCQIRNLQILDPLDNNRVLEEVHIRNASANDAIAAGAGLLLAAAIVAVPVGGAAVAAAAALPTAAAGAIAAGAGAATVATTGAAAGGGLYIFNDIRAGRVFISEIIAMGSTAWIYDDEGLKADENSNIRIRTRR